MLITRVITFEVMKPIRPRYLNVTDGQTDGRLTVALVGAYARDPAEGPAISWAPRVRSRKPARWENQMPIYL